MATLNPIRLRLNEPCPCERGKTVAKCGCLRSGGHWRPPAADTRLPRPATGIFNPRCYFAALGNCTSKLSREHFVSKGILKLFHSQGGLKVSGLPWQDSKGTRLSPDALASKILCVRHNSSLSALDDAALRLYRRLSKIPEFLTSVNHGHSLVFLFNGHDIERWILKMLCGVVVSGNSSAHGQPILGWSPPTLWLNILDGTTHFPPDWGLYLKSKINDSFASTDSISFAPLLASSGEIVGAVATLNGFEFTLALGEVGDRRGTVLDSTVYRPGELVFTGGRNNVMLLLGWELPTEGKNVHIEWTAPSAR